MPAGRSRNLILRHPFEAGNTPTGGVGYVLGTALGVMITGIITVVPTFQGHLSSWWTKIAVGLLLLLFILLQRAGYRGGALLARFRTALRSTKPRS